MQAFDALPSVSHGGVTVRYGFSCDAVTIPRPAYVFPWSAYFHVMKGIFYFWRPFFNYIK